MTRIIKQHKFIIALSLFLAVAISPMITGCSTLDDATSDSGEGDGQVSVSLTGISDQSEESLTRAEAIPQTQFIRMDDGLMVGCTLTPDASSSTRSTSSMTTGNVYRMAVYQSGTYVASQLYTAGSESSTSPIDLQAGSYTFVFYSFNNTTDPGAPDTSGNLAVAAGVDLLYYSVAGTVTSGATTQVSVVFQHKYSTITVVGNAAALVILASEASTSGVGRTFTSATASINNSYATSMAVSTGTLTAGTTTTPSLSWTSTGATTLTSTATPVYTNGASSLTVTYSSIVFQDSHSYSNKAITFDQTLVAGTRSMSLS